MLRVIPREIHSMVVAQLKRTPGVHPTGINVRIDHTSYRYYGVNHLPSPMLVAIVVVVTELVVAGYARKLLPGCSCTATAAAVPSSNCRSFVSRATEISRLK